MPIHSSKHKKYALHTRQAYILFFFNISISVSVYDRAFVVICYLKKYLYKRFENKKDQKQPLQAPPPALFQGSKRKLDGAQMA